MSNQVKNLFNKFLTEAEGDILPDREREFNSEISDTEFPEETGDEFKDTLDPDTDSEEFETDSIGFDSQEQDEEFFADLYAKIDQIRDIIQDLIDPKIEGNLTSILAKGDRPDSVLAGLYQKLDKPISKASDSLSSVMNLLNQTASAEPALKRRLDALTTTPTNQQ